jgi:hypothetical protein
MNGMDDGLSLCSEGFTGMLVGHFKNLLERIHKSKMYESARFRYVAS